MEPYMSKQPKIPASDEAWDNGELGRDEEFVKRVPEKAEEEAQIDKSLDLQLISIRLQKSLIEDFKYIAELHGIGYQPLMRQVLKRFADCEKKDLLRERARERKLAKAGEKETGTYGSPAKQRKIA